VKANSGVRARVPAAGKVLEGDDKPTLLREDQHYLQYITIVCKLCGVITGAGIGSVFGSLVIGYARNPSLKQQLFSYAILGFALSEAMGLFCLMMAFLILFAF